MRPFILTCALLTVGLNYVFAQKDYYARRWSDVYRYEARALPRSAVQVVDSIYSYAKRERNIPQFTKALIYQSKFAFLQENAELAIVDKLKKEIADSKGPQRNILESILANVYWQYFQENRYTYYNRSRTSEKVNENDFRTWDADQMMLEIHQHFKLSLAGADQLQKMGLGVINDMLTVAENSRLYRPTVFDLLSHNALAFYSTEENHLKTFKKTFSLDDPKSFEEMTFPVNTADTSQDLEALRIFKSLLEFHKKNNDTAAYVSLEIDRLQFLKEHGKFENVNQLYTNALKKLQPLYEHHSSSTLIDFELASTYYSDGDEIATKRKKENQFKKRDALILCDKAIQKFPKSDGAEKCKVLREMILEPWLNLKSEKYTPIDIASRVEITYRNTHMLALSVYKATLEFQQRLVNIENDSVQFAEIQRMTSLSSMAIELKDAGDYQEHRTEIVVPRLSQGRYMLLVEVKDSIEAGRHPVFAYAFVQITNLALIESSFREAYRYQVVDRNTGAPVESADLHFKGDTDASRSFQPIDVHMRSNKNGFVELTPNGEHQRVQVTVSCKNDQAVFGDYYIYRNNTNQNQLDEGFVVKSFLFSDRSIYRPGQTVFFKGILIKTKNEKSSVVANQYVEVFLEDVNNKEVGSIRIKTNAYGSFSGQFTLPASGLTGEYTMYADEDSEDESRFYDDLDDFEYEELAISVEEYKRPTFESSFDPVKETFKLNDTITISGKAIAYSDARIGGAKVSYHVKRSARFPSWHYWNVTDPYSAGTYSEEEEITFGETQTDKEGKFQIKFLAIPDESISKEEQPVFSYEITADVTDINGETRSATATTKVGYHSVTATINVAPLLERKAENHTISIATENLNGQPVTAKGMLRVFKLSSPDTPGRPRRWPAPDLPLIGAEEFKNLFPHDSFEEESNFMNPKTGKVMFEYSFDTGKSKEIKLPVTQAWPLGGYVTELTTRDPNGIEIIEKQRFRIIEAGNKTVADNDLFIFETNKDGYQVGENIRVKIGSASPDITVTIDIEQEHKIIKTYVEHLSGNTKEILIPVTDAMTKGLAVHCSATNFNAFFSRKKNIPVLSEQQKMEIETITFKDRIQPGGKETWSFEIKGSESVRQETEVLASMYDASLDQFKPHQWTFEPVRNEPYYSYEHVSGGESFDLQAFSIRNESSNYFSIPRQYFDQLDWFGFSISNNYYIRKQYLERLYSAGADPENPSKVTMLNSRDGKEGFIYGTITASDGQPLPGVNVVVKGTTRGTVTDAHGNYMIEAGKGDVLIFSFIGLSTAEAEVRRKNTMNVTMEEDVTRLEEVVVTALGVQKSVKSLGYSIATIAADSTASDAALAPVQARAAGVQIMSNAGVSQLVIRGAATLNGSNSPLYVVDGVLVESTKIDQEDVANIQVLKGDAATAIYGSKAVNGVIIVATKSGQKKMDEELAKVNARKNFNETAFFFPHITTDETGKIRFTFTTPESLTRWKLQLLAHTKDLVTATKTLQTITQKEIMVTPNPPRFLRESDDIIFSVRISNLSVRNKEGKVGLQLSDAVTGQSVDQQFQNIIRNQAFKISARGTTEVSWKLKVPKGVEAVQYRIVAKAGSFSDGEQNILPVLSNRTLVTETLPMFIRSGQTKKFSLDKLRTTTSNTLQNHRLTLEVTSNPVWYAIQSLPYLMEFPHECAEQLFSRFYANSIASNIANSNPKIKAVFDQWASSNALISNLEKNKELRSIIIEETPWIRDAQDESEQKKRVALLFDLHTMNSQLEAVIDKLREMQMVNGGFPWFAGDRQASRFITQHIASGFGHLMHLNMMNSTETTSKIVSEAVRFLDEEIAGDHSRLLDQAAAIKLHARNPTEGDLKAKEFLAGKHIRYDQIQYLYMKSFFVDLASASKDNPALEYYLNQCGTYWKDFTVYMQGMTALIQNRNKNIALATAIIRSLKENAIINDEFGMYWKENQPGWFWHQSPVETQSLLIEAFSEIQPIDQKISPEERNRAIDDLRIWLLKNKQTTQWKTTKATTEAIYALLLTGADWISLDKQVDVTVGNKKISPDPKLPEAGTGYFKTSWKGEEITAAMSEVTLVKRDEGIAWGGLYWQYFEDLDKITSASTPLQLSKKVFLVKRNDRGEVLTEVDSTSNIAVGDLLRIRIELKADREMEFLHMKDMRASGLEPVDVLSEYKWQEGLGYYQSTKDASTNFFFTSMLPGVYVFEYDLRVNNKGNFSNGITTIQSMYAPEFSSHSEGIRILVK